MTMSRSSDSESYSEVSEDSVSSGVSEFIPSSSDESSESTEEDIKKQ